MIAVTRLFLVFLASLFKSRCRLEAENAALRHQVMVLLAATAQAGKEPDPLVTGPPCGSMPRAAFYKD